MNEISKPFKHETYFINKFKLDSEATPKAILKRGIPPRKPKFEINEELKFSIDQVLIEKDTGNSRDYINIRVKDINYSPTLKDNIYIVIILDTVGKIEDYLTEKYLETMVIK